MELLGSKPRSERWTWKGNRTEGRNRGGLGKRVPFSFRVLVPLPVPRLFAPALQVIEFVQYSFNVHNKVVVTENLGSVLQFHLIDIEKSSDVYSWQRCIKGATSRTAHARILTIILKKLVQPFQVCRTARYSKFILIYVRHPWAVCPAIYS